MSSADERGVRGVGGVCQMCMWLALVRGLGFGITNPVETRGGWDVWVGSGGGVVGGFCGVMYVCVVCPGICILY